MSKRSRNRSRSRGRVVSTNANLRLPLFRPPSLSPLSMFEDRRRFHPAGPLRSPRTFSRRPYRLVLHDRKYATVKSSPRNRFLFPSQTKAVIAFDAPRSVLVCVRRHRRKEVLHALGKAGRVGQRKPKRNFYSSVHC